MPALWLLSDERNDAELAQALARLPRRSGFVFRHYHLPPVERRVRFEELARVARRRDHLLILAGSGAAARRWGADGVYGPAHSIRHAAGQLAIATAHSLAEVASANRLGADALMLSPVFPTRSHPGTEALGPVRFRMLAAHARVPVIALGGMTARTAARLCWPRWAAIDGLTCRAKRRDS